MKPKSVGDRANVSSRIGDIIELALPNKTDKKYAKLKGINIFKQSTLSIFSLSLTIKPAQSRIQFLGPTRPAITLSLFIVYVKRQIS
jgi:hypothetical protein